MLPLSSPRTRSSSLVGQEPARARGLACLVLLLPSVGAACRLAPSSVGPEDGWAMEVQPVEIPAGGIANPSLDDRPRDGGHFLFLVTSSSGLDYSSTDAFFDSLYKHPKENQKGVGHCWIVLQSPEGKRSFGHTGEYGKEQPTYTQGVKRLMGEGDPDPARYLWEEMRDGELLHGSGGRNPTYCCRVPITAEELFAIQDFVEEFDYEVFALRGKGCSDYVVAAARRANLYLVHRLRLHLPQRLRVFGKEKVLWTDPRYGSIVFGSPELFESGLRELVARGAAEEVGYPLGDMNF